MEGNKRVQCFIILTQISVLSSDAGGSWRATWPFRHFSNNELYCCHPWNHITLKYPNSLQIKCPCVKFSSSLIRMIGIKSHRTGKTGQSSNWLGRPWSLLCLIRLPLNLVAGFVQQIPPELLNSALYCLFEFYRSSALSIIFFLSSFQRFLWSWKPKVTSTVRSYIKLDSFFLKSDMVDNWRYILVVENYSLEYLTALECWLSPAISEFVLCPLTGFVTQQHWLN